MADPDEEFHEPAWDPRYRTEQPEPQRPQSPIPEELKPLNKGKGLEVPRPNLEIPPRPTAQPPKSPKRVSIATRDDEDPMWELIHEADIEEATL